MKIFTDKKNIKKIVIVILLVTLFNFIAPPISRAEVGGGLFIPISQFLRAAGDWVIIGLQGYFLDDLEIKNGDTYEIKYSPGVIFSGNVRALDINFFNPAKSKVIVQKGKRLVSNNYKIDSTLFTTEEVHENCSYLINLLENLGSELYSPVKIKVSELPEAERVHDFEYYDAYAFPINHEMCYLAVYSMNTEGYENATFLDLYKKVKVFEETEIRTEIKSSAKILQPIVAKWYVALRTIALVGLLSVLVYIGIRILISSTSQEKAKYKKMIGNWLLAICLLFVLQDIMILILRTSTALTKILANNVIKTGEADTLMSTVRNNLGEGTEVFKTAFSTLVVYLVLVIYTLVFTVQYLKRVLYMAFFTMIAPLITLTYPLDKIKDGQAQAFSIWLREYIFNALLQPMHLLLYYIFVSSAIELTTSNWVYAIVAIGFLLPAEKFFRKMFGFDKAESSGQLGAAAGGALAMNAINSLSSRTKKQTTEGSSEGGTQRTPRYVQGPGVVNTGENGGASPERNTRTNSSGGSGRGASGSTGGNGRTTPGRTTRTNSSGGSGRGASGSAGRNGGASPERNTRTNSSGGSGRGASGSAGGNRGASSERNTRTNSSGGSGRGLSGSTVYGQTVEPASAKGTKNLVNGATTLIGHYVNEANAKKLGKGILRGAVKGAAGIAGAATLGTLGLAIGTATGDASKALGYTAAGAGTGFSVGSNLTDRAMDFEKKNREVFKEGALGTEEYKIINLIKELTNDNDFNRTCITLGVKDQKGRAELIRQFHKNGIKSAKDIRKAVNARVKTKASQEEVIAAYKIKKQAERDGLKTTDLRKRLISQEIEGEELKYVMSIIDML